jgi:CheY-like chemotaxis protein
VPTAIADKIFDPFVTDKQSRGGSGLGLAVSYSLAQAHNGTITFHSDQSSGTVFTVWLPSVERQDLIEVLVVDDDAAVRKLIGQVLARTGRYHVTEASGGIDGLLRIGTTIPDLLVLDLRMPGMNGLDVCRAVRENERLRDMQVLITTGHPNHPDLDEIRAMGYTDCYVKPIRVTTFAETVDAMMAALISRD